jgi:Membrane transport protein
MVNIILSSLVPVFFVMALGYLAGWVRDMDNQHVAELNALVMDFALPAALFVAMVQTPRILLLQQSTLLFVLALSMLVIYGLIFGLQKSLFKLDTPQAAVQSLTVAFPNLASAGLPLVGSVFGARNTVAVGISIAVGSIVLSPLTLVLLEAGEQTVRDIPALRRIASSLGKSILKPVVVAPIIGVVLSLCDANLPSLLAASLSLIGVGAGGIALFLNGANPVLPAVHAEWQCHFRSVVEKSRSPFVCRRSGSGFGRPAADRSRGDHSLCSSVRVLRHLVRSSLRGRLSRCRFDFDCVVGPQRRHRSGRNSVDRRKAVEAENYQ